MSSVASDPIASSLSGDTDSFLHPDTTEDGTVKDFTLVQAVDNNGALSAIEQVLMNQDILPLIFLNLKDNDNGWLDRYNIHQREAAQGSFQQYSWKAALSSLILVNKSFFHTGADLLWHTMNSFTPVLKLLPWFQTEYRGVGSYNYTGSKDWNRLKVYRSRIRQFRIESTPDVVITHDWLFQLLSLHERPDPLFQNLHSIALSKAAHSMLHMLFILAGPPLRNLEIGVNSRQQHDKVLAVLPSLPNKTPDLTVFHYRGPHFAEFFRHLSKIKTIQWLELGVTRGSNIEPADLELLRHLPNIRNLKLEFEPTFGFDKVYRLQDVWKGRIGDPETAGWTLQLNGSEPALCFSAMAIAPTELRSTTIQFTTFQSNYTLANILANIFRMNMSLEEITIECVESPRDHVSRPSLGITRLVAQSLQANKRMASLVFLGLSYFAGEYLSPILQATVPRWKQLKVLCFQLHENAIIPQNETKCFPNLPEFLFTIYTECPILERLCCQFDDDSIRQVRSMYFSKPPLNNHPLWSLHIYTADRRLQLNTGQKIGIATYLAGLFPRLDHVSGSASETWNDIEALVWSYQEVREWGPLDPHTSSEA